MADAECQRDDGLATDVARSRAEDGSLLVGRQRRRGEVRHRGQEGRGGGGSQGVLAVAVGRGPLIASFLRESLAELSDAVRLGPGGDEWVCRSVGFERTAYPTPGVATGRRGNVSGWSKAHFNGVSEKFACGHVVGEIEGAANSVRESTSNVAGNERLLSRVRGVGPDAAIRLA